MDKSMYLKMTVSTFMAVAPIKPRNDIYFEKPEEEKRQIRRSIIDAAKRGEVLPD